MHALSPLEDPVESIFNFIQNPNNTLCDVILKQNLLYESTVSPDMCSHKLQHYQQFAMVKKNARL